jgi:hypothetical protein
LEENQVRLSPGSVDTKLSEVALEFFSGKLSSSRSISGNCGLSYSKLVSNFLSRELFYTPVLKEKSTYLICQEPLEPLTSCCSS